MKQFIRKTSIYLLALSLVMAMMGGRGADKAYAADEYDDMREHRKQVLTGGPSLNPADPDAANALDELADEANEYWTTMDVSPTRTYLWSDLFKVGDSRMIREMYLRLRIMALAYSAPGTALYGNSALEADIVEALDYMYDTRYHEHLNPVANGTSLVWDWQIGIPMQLNDAVILMYDSLSPAQVTNYMNAVYRFTPTVDATGANRAWKAIIVGHRGILVKDSAKIAEARDGLSAIFNYVTSGDGFYADGSFIQHARIPYTGGYGLSLLSTVADLMDMLHGSTWQVTDPDHVNVWDWVYNAYQPLIYKGAFMDMTRGREISRVYDQDHAAGHSAIRSIVRLSEIAPTAEADDFKRMVKAWIQGDDFKNFYADAPLYPMALAKAIEADANIAPANELILYKQYPGMDRAVQLRPGYGFGLALYSNRISSYEAINSENAKGWYTSAGMTSLYNGDLGHYSEDYWPTVDSYRLPGTTVLSQTPTNSHLSPNNWTGGTDMDGLYGISGMDLQYVPHTLEAKKSWFMFDDEIVALGAGIASTDNVAVETIVENRRLNAAGNNAFTVDGAAKSSSLGWSEAMTGVNWAHLAGSGSGADIGYYFPGSADLTAVREARTGNWKQINSRPETPSTNHTRNYMTFWFDHGADPTSGSYAYVLLPNRTGMQVAGYAANPDIRILENSAQAQAVAEPTLGLVGANFWQDAAKTVDLITVNKKASVMTKEVEDIRLDVSVSDPTKSNAGTILVELDREAGAYTADPGITVTQLSPTIKFTVNVNGAFGKTFKASFDLGALPPPPDDIIIDNADTAYVTKVGAWTTASTQSDRYGANYLHDGNAGKGSKSVTFTPDLPGSGLYEVYMMWPEHFNRDTNIPVDIVHAGGTASTSVDQTDNGGQWNLLGTYMFNTGTAGSVTISNAGTTQYVVADAVRFVPVPNPVPDPIIVDNADTAYVTKVGAWTTASTQPDRYGANYLHDSNTGKGSKSVTFTPDLPETGTYNVYMMWPEHFNRDTNIPVDIAHAGGTASTSVDQTSDGGRWNLLGTYAFNAGTAGSVTISNAGTTQYVVADAVMFEYVP